MRFLACAHSSLVSRTRYAKHGCRCGRQSCLPFFGQERELKYQSNVVVMPLTSSLTCSRVTGSSYCSNLPERQIVDSNFTGRTIHQFSLSNLYSVPVHVPNLIFLRHLHVGLPLLDKEPLKPSSKVEQTVESLKEDLLESEKPLAVEKVAVKKPLRQKIVDELLHYYHGFRLLFIDINVSRRLVWRVLNGHSLTRREHRLLVRTVSDLFRLVPFSVFVIVPFLELLLPLAIKLFPGMLPSTFQSATDKEAKMKQSLKVKLEMAKFLQRTLDDMAVQRKGSSSEKSQEFTKFFAKVRSSGEQATTEEIMKFSKLFEDEITLDSLRRPQLVALCRVLEMSTLGTNNFLRFQLRMKLRSLAADDKMIQKEGIDSLTQTELQQACRARGMRAYGVSETRLKSQLAQWLDLSLNEKVPPSLLLLSRALLLPETIPASDQLKATISVLPDTVVTQAKAAIGEREGKIDNKTKIDVIKEEERLIKEERQEMREEQKREKETEVLVDRAPVLRDIAPEIVPEVAEEKKIKELSTTDLKALEGALDTVGKDRKKLLVEKEELDDLKEELKEYQEDVADLKQVLEVAGDSKVRLEETKGAKRLFKKVSSMISKMDNVLDQLEKEEQQLKKDLQMREIDVATDVESKKKRQDLVSIEELIDAIKQIQKVPDESLVERISQVLSKIDVDQDGAIRVEDVLKVIELVGKEKVNLSKRQFDEIVELMSKEEIIELEEQIEKALEKGSLQDVTDKKNQKLAEKRNADPPVSVTSLKASDPQNNTKSKTKSKSSADG